MFISLMKPEEGMRILDIGGQPQIWDFIDIPLNITCLNLPGIAQKNHKSHHNIKFVEGDGCNMPQYNMGDFDMLFSNSVIEHVGPESNRALFASEVKRICTTYWIQTPYKYYPFEAHCGMPFWWFYSEKMRQKFINKWKKEVPAWAEMVETTTVVTVPELKKHFPNSNVIKEWFIFPKSVIVYRT